MADKRVPRTTATEKPKKKKAARVLYTLTPDELEEYRVRHAYMLQKNMELHASSTYMDAYQNYLIEEHGLPVIFDLNLETGKVTERPVEENAENGRV